MQTRIVNSDGPWHWRGCSDFLALQDLRTNADFMGMHEGKFESIRDFFLNIFTADNLARIAAQFDDVLAAYPEGGVPFQGNPPGERPEPPTLKRFFISYKTADSTELEAILRTGYRSQAGAASATLYINMNAEITREKGPVYDFLHHMAGKTGGRTDPQALQARLNDYCVSRMYSVQSNAETRYRAHYASLHTA
ncbi:hypothetical protein MMC28_003279 [Mycoblastus sanguinarius]|nr:hypothetical protein [Mycoblastus sanguinarius]